MIRMAPLEDARLLAFGRRRKWYMHRGKGSTMSRRFCWRLAAPSPGIGMRSGSGDVVPTTPAIRSGPQSPTLHDIY